MAFPSRQFSDVFERWVRVLESVDVRLAARRVRDKGRDTEHWRVAAATVRISSRPLEAVRLRHAQLTKRFGPLSMRNFTIKLAAVPVTGVPPSPEGHIVQPLIGPAGDVTLGLYTGTGPQADLVRWSRHVEPWDEDLRARFEFLYQLPENTQHVDDLFSIERAAPIQEAERLTTAYLGLRPDAAPRGGNVFVAVESPARISRLTVSGASVNVGVAAPEGSPPMSAVLHCLDPRNSSLLQRLRIRLEHAPSGEPSWEGQAEFDSLRDENALSCTLEAADFGELDLVHELVANFRHVTERNPLLACVGAFWDLNAALDSPLLDPSAIAPARTTRTPQLAFQAAVAHLLTLAGIPTIDLGDRDKLFAPGTKVEQGTADLLGFHGESRCLIVGACTMNVPRPQDADALLNVTARLRDLLPHDSGVRFTPVLFSDQRGEPATRSVLAENGVRLVVHDDLAQFRALLDRGEHLAIVADLTGGRADL